MVFQAMVEDNFSGILAISFKFYHCITYDAGAVRDAKVFY